MIPLLLLGTAMAGISRFALLAGNNEGSTSTAPLVFAEEDARKLEELLVEVGGVAPEHTQLVLGAHRNQLLHAFAQLREEVSAAAAQGDETVVLFFYSGHADEERLQLGGTWVTWEELEELLARTGADVRLAFLDACQSGAATRAKGERAKGGARAPGFAPDLSEHLDATGQVIISSSSEDEASQESDEIGGSYFTHFLASGLSGAADEDGDRRVTLNEAYRHVYRETVSRTARSRIGVQHPTFSWELSGQGEVVLADLSAAPSSVLLPAEEGGRYSFFSLDSRQFIAEVAPVADLRREVFLPAGADLVQQRAPSNLHVAELQLAPGDSRSIDGLAFASVDYEDDVAKGSIDARLRRARRPRAVAVLSIGARGFTGKEVKNRYLPPTGTLGLATRWEWRKGPWVGGDLAAGAAQGTLQISEQYLVPVQVSGTTLGLTGGISTPPARLQAALGARFAATWLRREFPDQDLDPQSLFTIAPGLTGRVSLRLGSWVLETELRAHYLPYQLDGESLGLGFLEAQLAFGHRF